MAPEAPGDLVTFDLRYDENTLVKTVERVEPSQSGDAAGWSA